MSEENTYNLARGRKVSINFFSPFTDSQLSRLPPQRQRKARLRWPRIENEEQMSQTAQYIRPTTT